MKDVYSLSQYTYELPSSSIAQEAVHPHHDARMMVIGRDGVLQDESTFWNLDQFIGADTVVFFNNSKVIPARIRLDGERKISSDGKESVCHEGEILFLQKQVNGDFEALVRPGKDFREGTKIYFDENSYIEVQGQTEKGRILRAFGKPIEELMNLYGELPLPPYIVYDRLKEGDYQTVFAKKEGSVAAPTASLHFTKELLEKLESEKRYVTLHVGLGTFSGVKSEDIRDHQIHRETVEIEKNLFKDIAVMKQESKSILAVGTTVCRTLESLPHVWQGLSAETRLGYPEEVQAFWNSMNIEESPYIMNIEERGDILYFQTAIFLYPGKSFHIIDELITNFHLPESSLIMLVSALIGREETLDLYRQAIEKGYRFFSLGDGMYIRKSLSL